MESFTKKDNKTHFISQSFLSNFGMIRLGTYVMICRYVFINVSYLFLFPGKYIMTTRMVGRTDLIKSRKYFTTNQI